MAETLPREIASMIAAGTDVKDIVSICRTNKRLNEQVCKNPNFYSALLMRDFGSWNYTRLPQEILPIERTTRDDKFLGGVPVYYGSAALPGGPAYIKAAAMPGTGNTVQIHDTDYIFYYFMWAPKLHKLVNYNKKYTDAEILEDLRNGEPVIRRHDYINVFGLTPRRRSLLTLRKGVNRGVYREKDILELANLWSAASDSGKTRPSKSDFRAAGFDYGTLFSEFNFDSPEARRRRRPGTWRQWLTLLWPTIFEDLSLEYSAPAHGQKNGFSLAYVSALEEPNTTETEQLKARYEDLLRHYGVIDQIRGYRRDISDPNLVVTERVRSDAKSLSWALQKLLRRHFGQNKLEFPESDSLWPDELSEELVTLQPALEELALRPLSPVPQQDLNDRRRRREMRRANRVARRQQNPANNE